MEKPTPPGKDYRDLCRSAQTYRITEIPTPIPTFATTPSSMEYMQTSSDVIRGPEVEMAGGKPEVVVSSDWMEISQKFQSLTLYLWLCLTQWNMRQPRSTLTDGRQQKSIRFPPGIHRFHPYFHDLVIIRCLHMFHRVGRVHKWWGRRCNF
jgi:hypothetical protein